MFALAVKNGKTRIYLTDGTGERRRHRLGVPPRTSGAPTTRTSLPRPCSLRRRRARRRRTRRRTFPATYNAGWQLLTSKTTSNPYFATDDFCWAQCWYDEEVYSPAPGMPDTVYVIGANLGEHRASRTCPLRNAARTGAPSSTRTRGRSGWGEQHAHVHRPRLRRARRPVGWCALAAYLAVPVRPELDPPGPTRDRGQPRQPDPDLRGLGRRDGPHERGLRGRLVSCTTIRRPLTTGSTLASSGSCAGANGDRPHRRRLGRALQFMNVAINPVDSCEGLGGTQDNGTWTNVDNGTETFTQTIYGDGGNAATTRRTRAGGSTNSRVVSATRTSAAAIPRGGSSPRRRS